MLSFAIPGGCANEPSLTHVPWPLGDYPLAFVVRTQGESLVASAGPYRVEGGTLVSREGVVRIEAPEGSRVFFLGFTEEQLDEMAPTHSRSELSSAELSFAPSDAACPSGSYDSTGARVVVPVGDRWSVVELSAQDDASPPAFFSLARLDLELDASRCIDGPPPRIVPFGADARALPPGIEFEIDQNDADYYRFRTVLYLDDTRVVALAKRALYLFERGGDFTADGTPHILVNSLPDFGVPGRWLGDEMAIDRTKNPPEIILAASRVLGGETQAGAVFVLSAEGGALALTRTATSSFEGMRSIAVDDSGALVAGGTHSNVLVAPSTDGPFSRFAVNAGQGTIVEVAFTGHRTLPHLFGLFEGVVYVGDAFGGVDALQQESLAQFSETVTALMGRPRGGAVELWAADFGFGLFRREDDGAWAEQRLSLPPHARACAGTLDECGRAKIDPKTPVWSMVPSREGQFLFVCRECTGIFEASAERGCVQAYSAEAEPNLRAVSEVDGYDAISIWRNQVLVGGGAGRLLELTWPE